MERQGSPNDPIQHELQVALERLEDFLSKFQSGNGLPMIFVPGAPVYQRPMETVGS
jgi:hypothetical protein